MYVFLLLQCGVVCINVEMLVTQVSGGKTRRVQGETRLPHNWTRSPTPAVFTKCFEDEVMEAKLNHYRTASLSYAMHMPSFSR
jgi:hypothetical protein